MLKQLLKRTAYRLAPRLAADWDEQRWLKSKVAELVKRSERCRTPEDYLEVLERTGGFQTWQKRTEILQLLGKVRELEPQRALEVGSLDGGTLFLFTQMCSPAARIYSVDIQYSSGRLCTFPQFARRQQQLVCIEGDSHSPATKARLEEHLAGQKLDFVFIDGDHSYNGVSADFKLYSPLVRPGGLIAFHDIVADHRQRYGTVTKTDSGEVPRFWSEIRRRFKGCEELIENPDQDGCGIGVVRWLGNG